MSFEDKLREKEGLHNKKVVIEEFLNEQDEIDEFVIAIKYKDGSIGMRTTHSDPIAVVGILETVKLFTTIND